MFQALMDAADMFDQADHESLGCKCSPLPAPGRHDIAVNAPQLRMRLRPRQMEQPVFKL